MKCEEVLQRIHDDGDTGLEASLGEQMARHLESCSSCAGAAADWQRLTAEVRHLSRSLEPEADLWPSIEGRLLGRGRRSWSSLRPPATSSRWLGPLGLAASLLLALALVWTVVGDRRGAAPRLPPAMTAEDLGQAADLARYEDHVLPTRRDLMGAVALTESRLSAEVLDGIAADVQILHRAIGEIRLALQGQPDSRHLTLMLANRYRQEADLVKRLARL